MFSLAITTGLLALMNSGSINERTATLVLPSAVVSTCDLEMTAACVFIIWMCIIIIY